MGALKLITASLSGWRPLAVLLAATCFAGGALHAQAPAAEAEAQSAGAALAQAHAHNDYYHDRPLLDALDRGFASVEVDIHLVGQDLLVAHDAEEVDSTRTLEGLYLAPLREWVIANEGQVHRDGSPLLLLIDIKTDAEATYARLHPLLRQYADILTITAGDRVVPGPVLAVISGNRPRSALLAAPVRFAAFDGRLVDLEAAASLPPVFMPLISDNWAELTEWRGEGPAPADLAEQIAELASRAHAQGRRLRFWGTPDDPVVWTVLRDAGVDLIGTDDLEALRTFFVNASEGS